MRFAKETAPVLSRTSSRTISTHLTVQIAVPAFHPRFVQSFSVPPQLNHRRPGNSDQVNGGGPNGYPHKDRVTTCKAVQGKVVLHQRPDAGPQVLAAENLKSPRGELGV